VTVWVAWPSSYPDRRGPVP